MIVDFPTQRKKGVKDSIYEKFGIDTSKYTDGGNFINVISTVATSKITYSLISLIISLVPTSLSNQSTLAQPITSVSYKGTGGADHVVFGYEFIGIDSNSTCNGGLLELNSGESSSIIVYGSSTPFGSTFQFDFTPTGELAANIAQGRLSLYEIVYGDNSFEHLSVKNLVTDELVDVYPISRTSDGSGGRINMGLKLSTTTENTVRVTEIVNSSTAYNLLITVNGKKFMTEDIRAVDYKKRTSVYLALLDGSKDLDNKTGLFAPELRICN